MNSIAAKRFYKSSSVDETGIGVMLDERRLRTPANAVFAAPTRALAEAIAAEWSAQGEHIAPSSMPLTQLAFAAIDAAPARRTDLAAYVAKFGETDLLCHRADSPPALVERQAQTWDPLLAWSEQRLGVRLPVVAGVLAAPTDEASIETLRAHAEALDDFRLTALAQAAGASGSALIAFALAHRQLDAAGAFAAAALDDLWSQETWGRDGEAQARLDRLRAEFEAIDRFFAALA